MEYIPDKCYYLGMNSEKVKLKRLLKLNLPKSKSAFLWGARKTGKSTFLREKFPKAKIYDLLKTDLSIALQKEPSLLRKQIQQLTADELNDPIIVDEIQKVPQLLDEIHWLIENTNAYFILCSSSARKLRYGAANLLGGRAWRFNFYPLVYPEIPDFDILRAFSHGLLPEHYLSEYPKRDLDAYLIGYLHEEIQAEALTRNLRAFSFFLDAVSFSHGEMINYSNIARDVGVDAKTVKEYFQILVDTLMGHLVFPFHKKIKRDIISATPKFYLFDVGLANQLAKREINDLKGTEAGRALEHFIFTELIAYRGLNELNFPIEYWRTKTGLEVDFVLDKGRVAVEVKISNSITKSDIKGLLAFTEEHKPQKCIVVTTNSAASKLIIDRDVEIIIYPWQEFLQRLWNHEIIGA